MPLKNPERSPLAKRSKPPRADKIPGKIKYRPPKGKANDRALNKVTGHTGKAR
jgi:hypothetical protein